MSIAILLFRNDFAAVVTDSRSVNKHDAVINENKKKTWILHKNVICAACGRTAIINRVRTYVSLHANDLWPIKPSTPDEFSQLMIDGIQDLNLNPSLDPDDIATDFIVAGIQNNQYAAYVFGIGNTCCSFTSKSYVQVYTLPPPGVTRAEFYEAYQQELDLENLHTIHSSPQQLIRACSPVLQTLADRNRYINNIPQAIVVTSEGPETFCF